MLRAMKGVEIPFLTSALHIPASDRSDHKPPTVNWRKNSGPHRIEGLAGKSNENLCDVSVSRKSVAEDPSPPVYYAVSTGN
jgi:hypothetical protein